ncbi:hypothetical protein ES288_A09G124800v1 [Gossypium darwinii]|uniref:Uncharacterized protein n=1 Tax=Gossypium darwinii TaxID=34276 RepID=A0A5D2F9W1_GOSDA|nr:hypothetical protein ES288_A09G124800v1 [Gossypium darwinii]
MLHTELHSSPAYFIFSVRSLTNDIACRSIVASNESSTSVAPHLSTPKTNRVAPNHLSIMPANLACCTTVGVVIVVYPLTNPHSYSTSARKVSATPGKILTIRSTGVNKVAVVIALISVVLCIGSHGVIPNHRANTDGCSSCIVSIEVVLW